MDVKKIKIENQSYCHSTELKNPDILNDLKKISSVYG